MNTKKNVKNTSLLFANEDAIFRIVMIAKIVSWVILAVYLIVFVDSISSMIQQQAGFPNALSQLLPMIANIFYAPSVGLFYFLTLQGVAQALNLGLDIFYELNPEDEEDVDA